MRELIGLEISSGIMRTFSEEVVLNETVNRLIKRSKEADEESGTKILYLALGFLRWYSREDGKVNYAPLVLKPISLKKGKGGSATRFPPPTRNFPSIPPCWSFSSRNSTSISGGWTAPCRA